MSEAGILRQAIGDVDPSWLSVPAGLLVAAAVVGFAPVPDEMAAMLAITAFCVSLWIGTPVEPWFTGLLCLGLVGIAFSTELALVGFRSAATWLVVLGILLGEATRKSGLGRLVEERVLEAMPDGRADDALSAYRYLLVALSAAGFGLVFLVPSSLVRVLLLAPVLVSAGELFEERRATLGIVLGPLFVTYYGGTGILTASVANIIISGIVEASAGLAIGWVTWAIWMGPVMTVARTLAVVAVAYFLYRPANPDGFGLADDADRTVAAGSDERRMVLFLLVGVAIWATDAVHGLHPLFGALVVSLLAFAPRIGVVGPDAVGDADVSIVFFLGAIFAIAAGLQETGFTELAADAILSSLPADASLPVVLVFVVVAALALTVVMEGLAVASVLTPILVSFAATAGIPLLPVAMSEAIALNTYFFPYQSAVLVAILGLDVAEPVELIRMATACSLVTLFVLLPVQIGIFVAFL